MLDNEVGDSFLDKYDVFDSIVIQINAMAWLHIPAKRYTRIRPDRALSLYQLEVSVQ